MKREVQEARKSAYAMAAKLNNFRTHTLAGLHKVSPNIVEKWLYAKNRYPDFQAVYELYLFTKYCGGEIPIELSRMVINSKTRVYEYVKAQGIVRQAPTIVGDRFGVARFKFNGELLTKVEIAERLGISPRALYGRMRNHGLTAPGSDITELASLKRGRKRKTF